MQATNMETVNPPSIVPKEEVKKYDSGKPMVQLVDSQFILEVAKVMTFGAKKYGENNWKGAGGDPQRTYGSTMRHLLAWHGGEVDDPESGLPHLAHAATEIMFTMYYEKLGRGEKGKGRETTFEGPTHRIHVSRGEEIKRIPLEARGAYINKVSELAQYLRESADAEEAEQAAKGEGEEQKQEVDTKEGCHCEAEHMAIVRVAQRLDLTAQALMSFMVDRSVQVFLGDRQYTQSQLIELVNKEQDMLDLEENGRNRICLTWRRMEEEGAL
jgi:hypothetical protein